MPLKHWYNEFNHGRHSLTDEFRKTHVLEMSQAEWKKCYDTWFERIQKCIDNKEEYFKKQ